MHAPARPPARPLALFAALIMAPIAAACGAPPPGPPPPGDGGPGLDAWRPPVVCARPEEGCPCDADAPIECYPEADEIEDGARVCHRGTRTCRDGIWSACESIESWLAGGSAPGRASAGLIGGSEECDDCNPTCGRTTDEPDDGDVDPEDGLEYCDPPGGLCITPGVPPPPVPAGCDIFYEIGFRETADHAYTVTLPAAAGTVSVYPEDDGTTAQNEVFFVGAVVATTCPSCVPGASGRDCEGCAASSEVGFTITFQNENVVPTTTDQLIELDLVAVTDASSTPMEIDRQHVCLLVTAVDTTTCVGVGYGCTAADQCCSGVCGNPPSSSRTEWTAGTPGECGSSASACRGEGAVCALAADCCEGACIGGVCDPAASCLATGAACTLAGDCCTGQCTGGFCAARSCLAANATCATNGECCSNNCRITGSSMKCGSGSACTIAGEACGGDSDCCSTICGADGRCVALSFCRTVGEACTADDQCCGGLCSSGFCNVAAVECLPRYEICHSNNECCGSRCDPDESGATRCLALGGCRVSAFNVGDQFGETCDSDEQCCSGLCQPDPYGTNRCYRLNALNNGCAGLPPDGLLPDGEVCNNDCQCISGECEMLSVSTAHSRCSRAGACMTDGLACGLDEDCCGGVCALWPADDSPTGDAGYFCGLPPEIIYTMGTFERTWDGREETRSDGTAGCASNERPDWGAFTWTSTIDTNTEIRFEIQTASTLAGLDGAPVVSFTEPSATSPVDIGALLVAGGQPNFLQYLRLTLVLISNDGTNTPVIHDFSLEWVCVPTE